MTSSPTIQPGDNTVSQRQPTLVHRLSNVQPIEPASPEPASSKATARLESAKRVVEAARRGVAHADEAKLTALRNAVRAGTLRVDPQALADRLLEYGRSE